MTKKRKIDLLDKLMDKSVYTISFFVYSGFYAVLALAISVFGSGGSRFVSIPIRLLTTGLMVFVIAVTLHGKKNNNPKLQIVNFIFFIFWALYLMKLLWHVNSANPLRLFWPEYIFYSINFAILPFYMFSIISFYKYRETILNALIFSGFIMGLTTLYLYKDILVSGIGRINLYVYNDPSVETLSPLALSYGSVLTILLCAYKLLYQTKKSKFLIFYIFTTIGLSLIMFLLGASRGSVLALVICLLYMVLHSNYQAKIKIILLVLAFVPIFIWSVAASGSAIIERTSGSIDSGSTGREELWSTAWQEFVQNPILGGRIEIGYYPHNFILETLMATGIIGFLIIVLLLVQGFIKISILPKFDKHYLWVGFLFLQGICQAMFSGALYNSILVFFPLGILISHQAIKKT